MKSLKQALNETRPWGQEPGAERDEDERIDTQIRKSNRKDRMARWKRQKDYPMPGQQKSGFAKSPANEADAAPCTECGMVEGHADECSHMSEADEGSNECPECGGPPGKHDRGCPLHPDNVGGEYEPEREMDEASDLDDEDDMDTLGDDVDSEACPGCGSKPGDGINAKCDDPMGCGYWKEFKVSAEGPVGRSLRSMLGSPTEPDDEGVRNPYEDREGIRTDAGEWIENPFWDESGRDEVDPEEHYGDAFTKSGLAKRLRWGESSDYDGLPLTEGSMFDRFDTLVGHRSDGTFDDRVSEASKLRALIKKVVGEVRMKEMKLSVAGPAFGAANTDDVDDEDEDEDYKILAPKKASEPEESGVRIKSKSKKPKS